MQAVITCRQAKLEDVSQLFELIDEYSKKGIMLPRSRAMLERQIGDFIIAEAEGAVVGCGSLCKLGDELVEIRSLGISDGYKGRGLGSMLVKQLEEMARNRSLPRIMALTYEVSFFLKNGYHVVEKDIFPEKVWRDCVNCAKQQCCDEIAVLKILN